MSHRGDNETVLIRDARMAEFPALQGIDLATGQMFCDIGMPEIADYGSWPLREFEDSRAAGLLWVEVTPGLREIREREAAVGLDRWPRVCMRRDLPGSAGQAG